MNKIFTLIITLILNFCINVNSQRQTYIKCTFDTGVSSCRLVPLDGAPELDVDSVVLLSDVSIDPILPLSDVTSITKATVGNGLQCKLPYQLNGISKDIYFCSKITGSLDPFSCITTDTTMQECDLGGYASSQFDSKINQTYYIEVIGTTEVSCISLYYYITRPNAGQIIIWSTSITGDRFFYIGKASDVPYNGWHPIEFSFSPHENNYHIHFTLERLEDSEDPIFIALDQILIVDGRCESDIIQTSTKSEQTIQTSNQQILTTQITTGFDTITTFTPEESISKTTPVVSPPQTSADSIISTQPVPSETSQKTTMMPTTLTTTDSQQPLKPLFRCDFSSPCFGTNQLIITDGSEFNPDDSDVSEPPRAPTSDVTSVLSPTSNNEICKLPYRPKLNNGASTANWDMWFCYNNQCPTPNGETGICLSGSYGLITIDPSESSKTIIDSLNPNTLRRDANGDQCLRFYYYFTIYNHEDWGQRIRLWIRPNNETDYEMYIGGIEFNEMKNNSWNFREISFNSALTNYTLSMLFEVSKENRTENGTNSKTIFFALDNIELYDYNCSYVREPNPTLPSTTTSVQTITTTEGATPSLTTAKPTHLPLILGLSMGIGIPLIIIIIIISFHRYKSKQHLRPKNDHGYEKYFPLESAFSRMTTDNDAENDL